MSKHDSEVVAFNYGPGVTIVSFPQDYIVDWRQVLDELEPFITLQWIADKINKPLSTVKYWKYRSRSVPFEDGLEIIALWCKYTEKPSYALPKTKKT